MLILLEFLGFGAKNQGGGLTPKGKVAKPTHFVFKSFWISPLIWPSFIQIEEIACITPAWSSGGLSLNFKTYQKVRTKIHFSSKFTIVPFLYLQTICHLFTIIYYGTSLHRRHVISHTLKLNHITPNVSYAHAYKGFVPILIYQNK